MSRDYAVFLRANPNPSMEQRRAELTDIGLTDVASFGASGNLVFCSQSSDVTQLEQRISVAVGTDVFVRDLPGLAAMIASNPYADRQGSELFIAGQPVTEDSWVFREAFGPDGEPPIAFGATVYFVNPIRRVGRRAVVDFERELGVRGTRRTARVVARVLGMM